MPCGQVLGDGIVAEAAEVDDPPHPGCGSRPRETSCRGALVRRVVGVATDHVDQEVGDTDALERIGQTGRAAQIAGDELAARLLQRNGGLEVGVANQAADLEAVVDQAAGDTAADEAGRAGDENSVGGHRLAASLSARA